MHSRLAFGSGSARRFPPELGCVAIKLSSFLDFDRTARPINESRADENPGFAASRQQEPISTPALHPVPTAPRSADGRGGNPCFNPPVLCGGGERPDPPISGYMGYMWMRGLRL